MNITDYDKALYYTHHCSCMELSVLMAQTDDDILSKRIEKFISAFIGENNYRIVACERDSLLKYIDHVYEANPVDLEDIEKYNIVFLN
ncbi:YhdB family protein [Pseudalkalibacillus caeni]|uniref:Uncharacterized protein n=1 Tax=Exobacillus caeni TaxID=2574798 RepID=A0A5R9F7A5_9BACL|nr:YhdB family protein [Pseudalkalibacillus caeni]TLS37508.1 hypothetical protein FCL54_10215 [Pseudalkalibacillus caeni]